MNEHEQGNKLRLNLACGEIKKEGFVGVDIVPLPGVDIVHDLTKFPWPFQDQSVDEVFVSHYAEHVPDLIAFMNELYRITKPGAKVCIIGPYYASIRCWQDPTHVRALSEETFKYFSKEWREAWKLSHYPIDADFDFTYSFRLNDAWQPKAKDPKYRQEIEFAIKHFINVVDDIKVDLIRRA